MIKQTLEQQQNMCLENRRLVYYCLLKVLKISRRDSDYDDIVSVGNLGLIKAVETFDKDRKIEFSTYATKCILNEMRKFLNSRIKNEISLFTDVKISNSTQVSLIDILSDESDKKFDKELEDIDNFCLLMNYLLNRISYKYTIVTMYALNGYRPKKIQEILNWSCRANISRIYNQSVNLIQQCYRCKTDCNGKFTFSYDIDFRYTLKIRYSKIIELCDILSQKGVSYKVKDHKFVIITFSKDCVIYLEMIKIIEAIMEIEQLTFV